MNQLRVRQGRETDIEALLQLEQAAHAYPWASCIFEDLMGSRYVRCTLVEDGYQNKLAFSFVQSVLDEASLLNIVVAPEQQGKGIGRYLLNYLIDELLAEKRIKNFFLEVRVSNHAAIALYLSCGFVEVGERRDYYPAKNGSRENGLIMALPLEIEGH